MSDLKAQFDAAVDASRTLTQRPDNATLLEIYALFKQASAGDVSGDRPDSFDMVGTAKYDAWEAKSGMTREAAMQAYIDLIGKLAAA